MTAVYVEITATKGSAPRDAGTVMAVTPQAIRGTIGGGALEHRAIATARQMLATGEATQTQTVPLGPGLGQCCGGAVTLRFAREPKPVDGALILPRLHSPTQEVLPLWVWGAGHVGRAVVRQASPVKAIDINWVDDDAARFPASLPNSVNRVVSADMPRLAAHAPKEAHHLIFTYSHDIDLALCAALLQRGFASCGLIGSDTKWARFRRRLEAMGLEPAPITCPIGDKSRGKHPDAIAFGALARLLHAEQTEDVA